MSFRPRPRFSACPSEISRSALAAQATSGPNPSASAASALTSARCSLTFPFSIASARGPISSISPLRIGANLSPGSSSRRPSGSVWYSFSRRQRFINSVAACGSGESASSPTSAGSLDNMLASCGARLIRWPSKSMPSSNENQLIPEASPIPAHQPISPSAILYG